MYYYFDDKADLYVTVVEELLEPFMQAFEQPTGAKDAEGFWRTLGETTAAMAPLLDDKQAIALFRDLFAQRNRSPENTAVDRVNQRFMNALLQLLDEGRALNAVRDDLPAELLANLLMGFGEAADLWFLDHLERLGEHEAIQLYGVVMGMFRALAMPPHERCPASASQG